jgi:integrase
MSTAPIFRDYALQVLDWRKADGVRGHGHEVNRFMTHLAFAKFASKPMDKILPRDLRDWICDMRLKKAQDQRGERLLDDATTKRAYALIRAVFNVAVERDEIAMSPCLAVKVKKRIDESATLEKWTVLTIEEQRAIAACEEIPLHARFALRFALATGLRQGEQFSLRLSDLHTGPESPHVYVRFGGPKDLPPKSGKPRKVPLFEDGLVAARRWLYELPKFAPHNPLGLVFPTERGRRRGIGKPLGNGGKFRDYLALVGITRRVRWHDLRHSSATNLITGALGGDAWSMSATPKFLGHSSTSITERYSHVSFADLEKAAQRTSGAGPGIAPAPPDTSRELETWFEDKAVAS